MQFAGDDWYGVEEFARHFDGHLQDVVDVLAFVMHFEGFAVVAFAVTDIAGNIDVRQKVHLDFDYAVALTGFTATALDVEREAAGAVAAVARLRNA